MILSIILQLIRMRHQHYINDNVDLMWDIHRYLNSTSKYGQTLGLSNTYIFWRIRMPACRQGILAGTVLAFARALGEYGATSMLIGFTPGKTATISTTVYQLWRTNDDAGALFWVMINLAISTVVLLSVNLLESRQKRIVKR